jgi:hypothetical protein
MKKEGWLAVQLKKNADEIKKWPAWMRKAANKTTTPKKAKGD